MNNQTLVIYDFKVLYDILTEISSFLNFNLICVNKLSQINLNTLENYLILTNKKINRTEDMVEINQFPIDITKLIETINVKFLKKKFNQQSEINLGSYKLNLNSRKIFGKEKMLDLTEREANIILFLFNSEKPVKVTQLQTEVWGHNSKLDTHTVETHIYRLRTKINKKFYDNSFILSSKQGYVISKK